MVGGAERAQRRLATPDRSLLVSRWGSALDWRGLGRRLGWGRWGNGSKGVAVTGLSAAVAAIVALVVVGE